MRKQLALAAALFVILAASSRNETSAQQNQTGAPLRVVVDLVQLNVAVTENKGNYIKDLQPADFTITEDGITEKIETFEEGHAPTRRWAERMNEETPHQN